MQLGQEHLFRRYQSLLYEYKALGTTALAARRGRSAQDMVSRLGAKRDRHPVGKIFPVRIGTSGRLLESARRPKSDSVAYWRFTRRPRQAPVNHHETPYSLCGIVYLHRRFAHCCGPGTFARRTVAGQGGNSRATVWIGRPAGSPRAVECAPAPGPDIPRGR